MSYFAYQGKNVYYTMDGLGLPCLFLHGNTASSMMFELLLPLYTDDLQVIRMDFLGNGRSERVPQFPENLWIDQGHQVVALAETLGFDQLALVGTSGGAYAAINAALLRPDLFSRVVADSFDGSRLAPGFAKALVAERTVAKADEAARGFYAWNQGDDWETVVDKDTAALVALAESGASLFVQPIETIQVPLLITVSRTDEMLANDMAAECQTLASLNQHIQYKIYEEGGHPLIASKAEEIAGDVKAFLLK